VTSRDAVSEGLYLKPNVLIEPLVDRFYAWLHTFAPATAAMNLAYLHQPLLDSFVRSPQVHANAVRNPKLRGGYFVDVEADRIGEVRALREHMASANVPMVELAAGIKEADELLRSKASGYDLTPLYAELPDVLRGFVELSYDLANHPRLRFIEPLLYRSRYYIESRQSIDLSLDEGAERPFILSTPRLSRPSHLQLPLPFRHEGIDMLFSMRTTPRRFGEIKEALEVPDEADDTLQSFFTAQPCRPSSREVDHGGRIRYFGHACLLLQAPGVSILTDPFISSDYAAGDRFTYVDLPDVIDYCLITHGHQDHIVLESLLQLRSKIRTVVVPRDSGGRLEDPSLRLYLQHLGFPVVEVDDLDEIPIPGGTIRACPFLGEHADLDIRSKTTYAVHISGRAVFVGADSSGVDPALYEHINEVVGPLDFAFIGMECDGAPLVWLYQALFTQPVSKKMSDSRKLSGSNAEQALAIVDRLGVSEAYVYAMGEESWLGHVMATSYTPESYQLVQVAEFVESCRNRGIKAEHLLVQHEWRW
jgi:L-ascorbate metabolism protein UlaG (beta-lactamase superfamily)